MTNNYVITEDNVPRNMTEQEIAEYKQWVIEQKEIETQKLEQQALKQETLAKLGLTADEVSALLS